jgi:hypothetical protein
MAGDGRARDAINPIPTHRQPLADPIGFALQNFVFELQLALLLPCTQGRQRKSNSVGASAHTPRCMFQTARLGTHSESSQTLLILRVAPPSERTIQRVLTMHKSVLTATCLRTLARAHTHTRAAG